MTGQDTALTVKMIINIISTQVVEQGKIYAYKFFLILRNGPKSYLSNRVDT